MKGYFLLGLFLIPQAYAGKLIINSPNQSNFNPTEIFSYYDDNCEDYFCASPRTDYGSVKKKTSSFSATAKFQANKKLLFGKLLPLNYVSLGFTFQSLSGTEKHGLSFGINLDSQEDLTINEVKVNCKLLTQEVKYPNGAMAFDQDYTRCDSDAPKISANRTTTVKKVSFTLDTQGLKDGAILHSLVVQGVRFELYDNGHGHVGPRSKVKIAALADQKFVLPNGEYRVQRSYYDSSNKLMGILVENRINPKDNRYMYLILDVDHTEAPLQYGWFSPFTNSLKARDAQCPGLKTIVIGGINEYGDDPSRQVLCK